MNADLLKRLQEVAGALNEAAPNQYALTPQQEELNALRMRTANSVANAQPVQALSTADKFTMALGNMLGSASSGQGFLPGAIKTSNDQMQYARDMQRANTDQLSRASQAANQTRLEAPNVNSFGDAIKLVSSEMNNQFRVDKANADRAARIEADLRRDAARKAELEFNANQKELDRQARQALVDARAKAAAEAARIKEQAGIDKENRKQLLSLNEAESKAEETLVKLEDAYASFKDYSQGSWTGTGPLATAGGLTKYTSEGTQKLDSKFKSINLDEMVKLFAGMSKAVDSDAERRSFEAAQPSITNDDSVNDSIFQAKIQAARSLLDKTKQRKLELDPRYKRLQELKQKYRR